MRICSFPPIANSKSRILILGTMPGKDSLKFNEYYAHPRNTFWKIMFEVLQTPFSNDYKAKQSLLLNNKIALWDILETCVREGSLDADIFEEEPADLKTFLKKYSKINHLIFNGKSSHAFFTRHTKGISLPYTIMPSTSPAHAISYEKKVAAWQTINDFLK